MKKIHHIQINRDKIHRVLYFASFLVVKDNLSPGMASTLANPTPKGLSQSRREPSLQSRKLLRKRATLPPVGETERGRRD